MFTSSLFICSSLTSQPMEVKHGRHLARRWLLLCHEIVLVVLSQDNTKDKDNQFWTGSQTKLDSQVNKGDDKAVVIPKFKANWLEVDNATMWPQACAG